MDTTRRSSARITLTASQRRQKTVPEPEVKKFIKIILPSTIKEKMMKIPARFVRLGPKLTDTVTIQTPAGFKRSIRIKRTGNDVWFDNGWSEFAEAHSISEGHFLYFCYEGNSSFRVMIFDVSTSEIDYPIDKVHVIESDDDVEVMDTDDEEGFARVDSSDSDSSDEESIDLEKLLKKKPRVSVKSETITID
ncbi:B3 domain-containing protein [Hirschfeldia incana]|nr:B3 domain-containing protein [Hirschfeldia incana]KAJ0230474.1 B3 domain-containing protein [Hirschfeldia incana]